MHTTYLQLVPKSPDFVPTTESLDAATAAFGTLVPTVCRFSLDEYFFELSDAVVFPTIQLYSGIDSTTARCPACGSCLTYDWLVKELAKKPRLKTAEDLEVIAPCCHSYLFLHELDYPRMDLRNVFTVGLARFCLSAQTPYFFDGVELDAWDQVERALGCKVKTLIVSY